MSQVLLLVATDILRCIIMTFTIINTIIIILLFLLVLSGFGIIKL